MEFIGYLLYALIAILVIASVGWWILSFVVLAAATKQDAEQGNATWVHGAIWSFFATCLLIGLIRGCE